MSRWKQPLRPRVEAALRREGQAQPATIARSLGSTTNAIAKVLKRGAEEGWARVVRDTGGRDGVVYALRPERET